MPNDSANDPEALTWLASTPNLFALASYRFESTEAAIEFVQGLYRAGAQHVAIAQDCIRDDPATLKAEGGPWADRLWVNLPDDAQKAQPVIQLCRCWRRRHLSLVGLSQSGWKLIGIGRILTNFPSHTTLQERIFANVF